MAEREAFMSLKKKKLEREIPEAQSPNSKITEADDRDEVEKYWKGLPDEALQGNEIEMDEVNLLVSPPLSVQARSKSTRCGAKKFISRTGPLEFFCTFNLVADENVSQDDFFQEDMPLVQNCMGGNNGVIFAYGKDHVFRANMPLVQNCMGGYKSSVFSYGKCKSQGRTHHRSHLSRCFHSLTEACYITKALSTFRHVKMNFGSIANFENLRVPCSDSNVSLLLEDSSGGTSLVVANMKPIIFSSKDKHCMMELYDEVLDGGDESKENLEEVSRTFEENGSEKRKTVSKIAGKAKNMVDKFERKTESGKLLSEAETYGMKLAYFVSHSMPQGAQPRSKINEQIQPRLAPQKELELCRETESYDKCFMDTKTLVHQLPKTDVDNIQKIAVHVVDKLEEILKDMLRQLPKADEDNSQKISVHVVDKLGEIHGKHMQSEKEEVKGLLKMREMNRRSTDNVKHEELQKPHEENELLTVEFYQSAVPEAKASSSSTSMLEEVKTSSKTNADIPRRLSQTKMPAAKERISSLVSRHGSKNITLDGRRSRRVIGTTQLKPPWK